ncbi:MAG: hypothetical protein MUD00_03025 [Candidatus Pacebacteria bacterium]|jgi:tRNA pseudouridine(55) synthase|nr:hypothetical protein [Candidatus Paceibacterota bacterium]
MDQKTIGIYKNLGETPLAALDRLRLERPELTHETLSYIGRLDPMAEGVMLVLVGEENKNREAYLGLDKEYECEVLFGVSTDTSDLLGLVTKNAIADFVAKDTVAENIKLFLGKRQQEYPIYSSKPVKGKPLHVWAREGRIGDIEIPKKEIEIYAIKLLDFYTIEKQVLQKIIEERIALVCGDFRQAEILAQWQEYFEQNIPALLPVAKLRVRASSGTYMRVLASDIGQKLGVPALAIGIKRLAIIKK